MTVGYLPRVIDQVIEHSLSISGAVMLEGVRACGKTQTGLHHCASSVRLDTDEDARQLASLQPDLVLNGTSPRLIDEWQLAPRLWNAVRQTVDDRRTPGQFILTGSATPADDITRHSGAGRILRLRLRPMSLFESGHSSGEISLRALMDGTRPAGATAPLGLGGLVDRLCVGGWPGLLELAPMDAQQILRSYLDDVARVDVPTADPSVARRDPLRIRRLLVAYARHVASSASAAKIAADTADRTGASIQANTAADYIAALRRTMTIEEQPSWGTHLRSRAIVRQAPVRHFVDPSLAVAALDASPARLLADVNTLGLLFESMVVRDLRVYAQPLDGDVLHYRDSSGQEADAIVQLRDGRWAAVEVKLGNSHADEAAASLHRLVNALDTTKIGEPTALIVVTAGQYAYTRDDGVVVVPLSCLRA